MRHTVVHESVVTSFILTGCCDSFNLALFYLLIDWHFEIGEKDKQIECWKITFCDQSGKGLYQELFKVKGLFKR